jgi:hypothetical protein
MSVPGDLNNQIGYIMRHGIGPNGGGTLVNQYTLIMDVYWANAGPGFGSLVNYDTSNTSDGDIFFRVADGGFGQGENGYEGNTVMEVGRWHRVAIAVDLAAPAPVVTKFLDGRKHSDWTLGQGLDGRRAMPEFAVLFGDNGDERIAAYVNSIQVRTGKLPDGDIAALGGPSADGIPRVIPPNHVTGQWDFNGGNLAATIGRDLEYFDGAEGQTSANTEFGTTTGLGVGDIAGEPADVMFVPGDLSNQIGYIMRHGIAPNGGGTLVNQYTLIMDIHWANAGPGFGSFVNCDTSNTSDGDIFFRVGDGGFGQGQDGYEGDTVMEVGQWHRVAFAVDLAAATPVVTKYLDGVKHSDWTLGQGLDGRRAMPEFSVLFGDNGDERIAAYVNSIQVRSVKLSDAELEFLGGPTAAGIPVVIPMAALPVLTVVRSETGVDVSWPGEVTGFVLESTADLSDPVWTTVPGVADNSVTVPVEAGNRFFRLSQ